MMNIILIGNESETPCLMQHRVLFQKLMTHAMSFFFYCVFLKKDFA